MTIRKLFRKFVCFMSKPIPARSPFWPMALSAIGIGMAWTYLRFVFLIPFQIPIAGPVLRMLPYSNYLPFVLAYVAPSILSFICLMPFCKALQILFPEEFDLYNDE